MYTRKSDVGGRSDGAAATSDTLPLTQIHDSLTFQLSIARTRYNYMRSYPDLDAVPLCASLPPAEALSTSYNLLVLRSAAQIAANFIAVAKRLVAGEIAQDASVFKAAKFLEDITTAMQGLTAISAEALTEGPTAFLKSTLYDMLRPPDQKNGDQDFLRPKSESDYAKLITLLPQPLMLALEQAPWMPPREPGKPNQLPCEDDWFFGYLQVAGFNTTNLRGVVKEPRGKAMTLASLREKIPGLEEILKSVTDDPSKTLAEAVEEGALFVCDYTGLVDPENPSGADSWVHGKRRYMPCPVAVFYWNVKPPAGFESYVKGSARHTGALQPIAIKLDPAKDGLIFTPNDCADTNDADGWKWKVAKYFVNVACAIQHESIAHLGECHFIMDTIAVATHRQLTTEHPIFKLLAPHLRFTLALNNGALNNLVIPGGVVATNVGPDIHWTLRLVNEARKTWNWRENHPEEIFKLKGVDQESGPLVYPFRDDTILLWKATKHFVSKYVRYHEHYPHDAAVVADQQLSNWISELTSATGGDLKGLKMPTTREELIEILAQIIYTAGPLHASVNYAQYPLGAYMPSVSATIYGPPPTWKDELNEARVLDWFPPLDIALYTLSFEYLLSSIQYDVFGHYSENPQLPYFDKRELQEALDDFQAELALAEAEIIQRNRKRPMPYPFQLPSRVPNSISI